MKKQNGFAHVIGLILGLLLLLAAIYATLYLTQNTQIFKSRAGDNTITFTNPNGSPLPVDKEKNLPVTDSLEVQLDLNPLPK